MIIIAHDIRSLFNVGSILRNAAAFNVEKVYLTGFTGHPPRKEIAKVALGAEQLVPWEGGDIHDIVAKLKGEGYRILALENIPGAESILGMQATAKDALILGNEVEGVAPEVLALADRAIIIPMAQKQSLNVAVASGIAMYTFHL